jgi:hypothetical protein
MRRLVWLLLLIAVGLNLAGLAARAQDEGAYSEEEGYDDSALLDEQEVTPISVAGRAVVDLAQAVSTAVADLGAIPDWGQVVTSKGRQSISATDMFVLLNRTMYRWDTDGAVPNTVSVTLGAISPPVLDPQDFVDNALDPEAGREIATDLFLSQAGECLRWMDRFQVVPTAVWVNGERLSAAEYLAGLAICIEYSYYSGKLEETILLPNYSPPPAWVEHTELLAETLGGEFSEESVEGETEALTTDYGLLPPVTPQPATPRLVEPTLTILPAPGSKVSGRVDIVVSYSGPPAQFVTFAVDGQTRAITNAPPYGYRWDTSKLKPGKHEVIVRAFGEHTVEIVAQASSYSVAAPKPEKAAQPRAPKP